MIGGPTEQLGVQVNLHKSLIAGLRF